MKDCNFFDCGEEQPDLDGEFLGAGFTPAYCAAAASDFDLDGLDDVCERAVAEAFRPQMVSASADDTRGEAYWAAQHSSYGRIRVAYLLGYYWDHGSPRTACAVPILPPEGDCGAHFGDSEWVAIDVEYAGNGWWRVHQACMSAHFDTGNDHTKCVPARNLLSGQLPRISQSVRISEEARELRITGAVQRESHPRR